MTDRAELLEATLERFPEGIALLGEDGHVRFWNRAAAAITGYASIELLGRAVPDELSSLFEACPTHTGQETAAQVAGSPHGAQAHAIQAHPVQAHARHKLGFDVSAMARLMVLRDGMGCRIGTAVVFHPAECMDALPLGVTGDDEGLQSSQDDLKERLEALFQEFSRGGLSFGVLWVTVDQAHDLRKTHGVGACEAMLQKIERTLAHGLRPAEYMGRWGDDEFLVVCHARTPAALAAHAQTLTGVARTADFRWWGDRASLTVSIGAAQAEPEASLATLLERAKAAMFISYHAGGNRVTAAPASRGFAASATEEQKCSPS
jgi:diguanylate cyclase (GGDEF)-like protein